LAKQDIYEGTVVGPGLEVSSGRFVFGDMGVEEDFSGDGRTTDRILAEELRGGSWMQRVFRVSGDGGAVFGICMWEIDFVDGYCGWRQGFRDIYGMNDEGLNWKWMDSGCSG
jgi:hypothetical protein